MRDLTWDLNLELNPPSPDPKSKHLENLNAILLLNYPDPPVEVDESQPPQTKLQSWNLNLLDFTVSEQDVLDHIQDPKWFLSKMLLFGTLISQITRLEDLSPGPLANTLFGGLVTIVREFPLFPSQVITSDPRIQALCPKVIQNCGVAEYQLETHYAKRILSGQIPLTEFPYYENYKLLMGFEAGCLINYMGQASFKKIYQVVFIGSGPLPLSSILLFNHLPNLETTEVLNFDRSKEAIEMGSTIVKSLGLSHKIKFELCGAEDLKVPDLARADIVYLAALVGDSPGEKRNLMGHLHKVMKVGSVLVARSAMGLRSFLYHPVGSSELEPFTNFIQFDPKDKNIINSVGIARKL